MSSIMWHYISQEPEVLRQLLQSSQTDDYADKKGNSIRSIYFISHGSSFNAPVCTLGYFSKMAGVRAYACTPANFCAGSAPICHEDKSSTLAVVISQTGTSCGAIEALEYAKSMGFQTLALTAVLNSPVDKKADDTLNLLCGEEDSNAKTKGYSATLMLLMLLALSLGAVNGTLDAPGRQAALEELEKMTELLPETVKNAVAFCKETGIGSGMKNLYVLGSGMNFGTAQ